MDKRLTGVCAGIAEYFNVDATLVRALYAILTFACSFFPGVFIYVILMLVMPNAEPKQIEN